MTFMHSSPCGPLSFPQIPYCNHDISMSSSNIPSPHPTCHLQISTVWTPPPVPPLSQLVSTLEGSPKGRGSPKSRDSQPCFCASLSRASVTTVTHCPSPGFSCWSAFDIFPSKHVIRENKQDSVLHRGGNIYVCKS